jgi:D-serine dehydratase
MFERAAEPGLVEKVRGALPCFWANPQAGSVAPNALDAIDDAEDRLRRAQSLLKVLFPVIGDASDPLVSPLLDASRLAARLPSISLQGGRLWIKADHELPIAGSIKARGGFHEVIAFAEKVALQERLIEPRSDLADLASSSCKALFARHRVVVGSTGNLGMSIGLIASALGFKAVVHMSSDAKAWKKQRLRDHGAIVVEHAGDYAQAVENGRRAAEADPFAHFVDDERSIDLFLGYAAAGRELAQQLADRGLQVDDQHPLFVYIPCGVGGAPGGVTYGLRRLFGSHVHCFFAEPVQSPCMLVQLLSGDAPVSVYDVGLTNKTEADGLAVGQASMLVAPLVRDQLDGIFTVTDDQLFALFRAGHEAMGLTVEPSAAAAFAGPYHVLGTPAGRAYLEGAGLLGRLANANHVLWTTGGSLAPAPERRRWLDRAASVPDFEVQAA